MDEKSNVKDGEGLSTQSEMRKRQWEAYEYAQEHGHSKLFMQNQRESIFEEVRLRATIVAEDN